jgi:hypothetical protein
MRSGVVVLVFLILSSPVFAQPDPGAAEEYFDNENYFAAITEYKTLLKLDRENAVYNFRVGLCYIRTNIDKVQAVTYLERAYKQPKHPTETPYYLAIAYTFDYKFDKAAELFREYRKKATSKEYADIDQRIKNCQTAKELMRNPIPLTFTNLGPTINTAFPDYYPFVVGDETTIYYTSRRKEGKSTKPEFDGYYASEVFSTSFNGDQFSPGKLVPNLNSLYDDQVVGLSADGENVFLFSTGQEERGALYRCYKKGTSFKKEPFIDQVNAEKSIEISGFLSPDGNSIFFSSNRSGGYGGYDIWCVRKLPTGQWAMPFNCGPEINTKGDEDFPTLSVDGLTIYFSSNGHPGMGGFDLYQASFDPETGIFSQAKNMGYPLNTPMDERAISFAQDGKHAYISAARKEGLGDLDIYRVTFEEVEFIQTLYVITIPNPVQPTENLKNIVINISTESGEPVGDYRPNPGTGRYTIILGPGKYNLSVEADGYVAHTEKIKVNEFTHRMGKIEKIINLVPNTQ